MRHDQSYDEYTRTVNDILTLVGTIGGLWGSFLGIGYIFVAFISQKLFMSAIVKKIYMFRKYDNLELEASKRKALNSMNGP